MRDHVLHCIERAHQIDCALTTRGQFIIFSVFLALVIVTIFGLILFHKDA